MNKKIMKIIPISIIVLVLVGLGTFKYFKMQEEIIRSHINQEKILSLEKELTRERKNNLVLTDNNLLRHENELKGLISVNERLRTKDTNHYNSIISGLEKRNDKMYARVLYLIDKFQLDCRVTDPEERKILKESMEKYTDAEVLRVGTTMNTLTVKGYNDTLIIKDHKDNLIIKDHKDNLIIKDHKDNLIIKDHKDNLIIKDHKDNLNLDEPKDTLKTLDEPKTIKTETEREIAERKVKEARDELDKTKAEKNNDEKAAEEESEEARDKLKKIKEDSKTEETKAAEKKLKDARDDLNTFKEAEKKEKKKLKTIEDIYGDDFKFLKSEDQRYIKDNINLILDTLKKNSSGSEFEKDIKKFKQGMMEFSFRINTQGKIHDIKMIKGDKKYLKVIKNNFPNINLPKPLNDIFIPRLQYIRKKIN